MATVRARLVAWAGASALVVLATSPVLAPSAEARAGCGGPSGITVVVDPNELGGSLSAGCDPDGGRAANNFADAGYTIEYSQAMGMNGFVCKVNGIPADGDCTQADAYWSLWWSDGKSGTWVYSSRGVTSLQVPDGGYVGFAWHQGGGRAAAPDVVPTPRGATATPKPTAKASPRAEGTSRPGSQGSATAEPGGPSTSPASDPTIDPTIDPTSASAPATSAPTSAVGSSSSAAPVTGGSSALPGIDDITAGPESTVGAQADDGGSGGSATWVLVGTAVAVLGAAASVPWFRRRSSDWCTRSDLRKR